MELDYSPGRFELLHKIGEGVHGVVMKARDLECDNRLVAIKRVALRNKYGAIATNTIREIKSLQQCDNENVSNSATDPDHLPANPIPLWPPATKSSLMQLCSDRESKLLLLSDRDLICYLSDSSLPVRNRFQIVSLLHICPDSYGLG